MADLERKRASMTPAERAKQFMPFAALKGYEEALRKKEAEIENMHLKEESFKNAKENYPKEDC